jgi:hypothetical protein
MGATQKALAHGVPVCVLPFGRDRFEDARRSRLPKPAPGCPHAGCDQTGYATRSEKPSVEPPALSESQPPLLPPAARRVRPTPLKTACSHVQPTPIMTRRRGVEDPTGGGPHGLGLAASIWRSAESERLIYKRRLVDLDELTGRLTTCPPGRSALGRSAHHLGAPATRMKEEHEAGTGDQHVGDPRLLERVGIASIGGRRLVSQRRGPVAATADSAVPVLRDAPGPDDAKAPWAMCGPSRAIVAASEDVNPSGWSSRCRHKYPQQSGPTISAARSSSPRPRGCMISRDRRLDGRSPRLALSSVATRCAEAASEANLFTSSSPNSLARNSGVTTSSGSSAYAPVKSRVSGSAVAKNAASTGISRRSDCNTWR